MPMRRCSSPKSWLTRATASSRSTLRRRRSPANVLVSPASGPTLRRPEAVSEHSKSSVAPRPFVSPSWKYRRSKKEEHADRAGLDPHRADIRLVQIYAGGKRVAVLDMYKVDWSVLTQVWECPLVVHNALFELAFLAKRNIEPVEVQDTLQAVRLLRGPDATSLESAVATYFDLPLPKDLQTSDWSARNLTLEQISYAATDAVVTWHLARKILPILHERTTAYEIQMGAIRAVVRMGLRGLHLDTTALNDLIAALTLRRTELVTAYDRECVALGNDVLRINGVPAHSGAIEALLELL